MNKLTALICITVFTFIAFFGATAIINASNKTKAFKEYGTTPYNEDLSINIQVEEVRTSKAENDGDHESAVYDTYFVVTKNNVSDEVTNLYAYVCSEANGKYSYTQTSYSSSIKATYTTYTYYRNTTMSLLNSSNEYAYKEYQTEDSKESLVNREPDTIYVRLTYDFKKTGETTTTPKELKYKFDYKTVKDNSNKISQAEEWTTTSGIYTKEESPFLVEMSYKAKYNESNDVDRDMLRVVTFDVKDSVIGEETVEKMSMQVYGEIGNTDLLDKGFDKYVKLFDYNGTFNVNKPKEAIDCSRQNYIASDYNIQKVYVILEMTLNNGTTYKDCFYTTVDKMPQA